MATNAQSDTPDEGTRIYKVLAPSALYQKQARDKASSSPITCSMTDPIDMSCSGSGSGSLWTFSTYALAVITVGGAVVITLGIGSVINYTPTVFLCAVILSSGSPSQLP
jgi:hypothetical protein